MSKLDEVKAANAAYASGFGARGGLPAPPGRQIAVLTCMDARMDPAQFAGLAEGDAHVICNAGGRASDDAIRSLVISYKLLGTKEWFVIHHTGCGMQTHTNESIRESLRDSRDSKRLDGTELQEDGACAADAAADIDWLTFTNVEQSVTGDVERIRNHPLVPGWIAIYGLVYNVNTGRLHEIPAAMAAGRPRA